MLTPPWSACANPLSKLLGPRLAQPTGSNRHHHHHLISPFHQFSYSLPSPTHIFITHSLHIALEFHYLTFLFCLSPLPIIMSSLALRRFASSRVSPESNLYPSTIVRCHVTKTNPSATACRLCKQQSCKPVRSTQLDQPVGSLSIAVLIRFPIISLSLLPKFLGFTKSIF